MIVEPGKTYVRRLRAVSAERDALALRLRLERALSAADFRPPGLPASAVLCVRKLTGRRAHALLAPGAGAHSLADWQRAVASAVERLARHAASPARGAVPANAEAVIFRDQAELLACLAADCCDEAAPSRWWWQSLFGGREAAAALLSAWLDAPEHVPAALGRLATAGKLVALARRLNEGEARAVLRNVARKFGLRELHAALEAPAAPEERPAPRAPAEAAGETDEGGDDVSPRAPAATISAPWERDVPELRGYGLGREQACLAGVGLMLLRAPARARSPSFARLVTDWRSGASATAQTTPTPAAASAARATKTRAVEVAERPPARATRREGQAGAEVFRVDARDVEVSANFVNAPPAPAPESRVTDGRSGNESATRDAGPDTPAAEPPANADAEPLTGARAAEPPRALERPRLDEGAAAPAAGESQETFEPAAVFEARIQTGFGGLFYLINVGLRLNLYGDFTTPLSPGLSLSVWDFVALLGRRLLGERITEDAVWPLLARLAGRREGEPPGHDFDPEDEWRLPAEWLAPFAGAGAWEWAAGGGRLRVRHPAGFLVLDVPLAAGTPARAAERRLADALKVYEGRVDFTLEPSLPGDSAGTPRAAGDGGEGGALGRWLDWLTPYVVARLRLALGAGEAARLLCEQAARVSVTETRLDVTFGLARLPVEVRLSGLDRDPGWVPAAGRGVAFHYE